jgi:hypothetical protein
MKFRENSLLEFDFEHQQLYSIMSSMLLSLLILSDFEVMLKDEQGHLHQEQPRTEIYRNVFFSYENKSNYLCLMIITSNNISDST